MKTILGILALLAALWPGAACALDPARSLSQLKHRRWTLEDHAPPGIRSIVQAPDGYLLLGAGSGLYRFDGVSFEFLARPGEGLGNNEVVSLLLRRSGDVWINYDSGSIAIYRDGALSELGSDHAPGKALEVGESQSGEAWLGLYSSKDRLVRYADGRWQAFGDETGLNEETVYDIVPMDGVVWVMTAHTLQYLPRGETHFRETGEFFPRGAALAADAQGRLWISENFRGTRLMPDYLHGAAPPPRPTGPLPVVEQAVRQTIVDRDGGIWGATQSRGVFRLPKPDANSASAGAEQRFGSKEGLTSDIAYVVFEDREGNIWVGTASGLDQFRGSNIVTETAIAQQSYFGYTLFASEAGPMYAVDSTSFYSIAAGEAPRLLASGFTHPESLCEGEDGAIYLTMKEDMIRWQAGAMTHIKLPPDYVDFNGCARDTQGRLWFTVGTAGVMSLDKGGWKVFPLPVDRRNEYTGAIAATPAGVIAYFNSQGLVRIDQQPWTTVASVDDLRIGDVSALLWTKAGLLIGGRYGLLRMKDGAIARISSRGRPWLESVQGLGQDARGDIWLLGIKGLVRIPGPSLERAFAGSEAPMAFDLFDAEDGLPGAIPPQGNAQDALRVGPDGRIWFTTTQAVAWLDPAHLTRNTQPPPVSIASLVADGQAYANPRQIDLHAGASSLEIGYTALSLSVPDRVRFRYKLEGVDRDWIDAGARRKAFYTKLAPGDYRFRVMAANNDGVWNETGATLAFRIPPTFLQSRLFIALCILAAVLLLWGAYTVRVRQVSSQMRRRLEERLAERERIARELHDTLLQGFQGLVLRFQAATDAIPASHGARRMMETALDQADNVIIEGRDRVRDLRSASVHAGLAEALGAAASRFAPDGLKTTIQEEGAQRELHSTVFEETLRIGEEAIANTARHASASAIEVSLAYEASRLRLSIRDNGVGIDPAIVEQGRAGHFGIVGMRERASRIGAQFVILSRPSSGTEVVLTVPASVAYKTAGRLTWAAFMRRIAPSRHVE